MADWASSEPRCTNYDEGDAEDDDDDGGADDVFNSFHCTGDEELSDMSDEEEGGGGMASVLTKRTNATGASSKKSSSGGKKRKTASLMDDSAVPAVTAGNKAIKQRIEEQVRHNKFVEDMEKRCVLLEEKQEEREAIRLNLKQNKFKSMSWQDKSDELNYKKQFTESI
jgi:hypothetical protein